MGSGRGRNAGEEVQGSTLPISAAQPPESSPSLYSAVSPQPAREAPAPIHSSFFSHALTWQKMWHFWYLGEMHMTMRKLDISNRTKTLKMT